MKFIKINRQGVPVGINPRAEPLPQTKFGDRDEEHRGIIRINYLKTIKIFLIFFLMIIFFNNPVFATVNDNQWNKAVQLFENNKIYFPHQIVSNTNELDSNGKIISNLLIYLKPRPDENIMQSVTKVVKDGKDITAEYRKKVKKTKSRLLLLKDINLLFDKDSQKDITAEDKTYFEYVHGKKCKVYNFYFKKNKKEHYKGKAWIEDDTSLPVKLDFAVDPLPFGVKELSIIYNYKKLSPAEFYLENIKVDVNVSLLFFHKIFDLSVDFKDYYKKK